MPQKPAIIEDPIPAIVEDSSNELPDSDWRKGGIFDPNTRMSDLLDTILNGPAWMRQSEEKSVLPSIKGTADARANAGKSTNPFIEGALESLYEDYVRPLGTATGIIGSAQTTRPIIGTRPSEPPSVIRGLLAEKNPIHDPFFASDTGRVQRASIVNSNPQEQARLLGYDVGEHGPVGVPSEGNGRFIDLGEVREAERLRRLDYTQHEHLGGTTLEIPSPNRDIPAQVGETAGGFNSTVPRSDELEYPYNIIPQAVQPRTSQTILKGLGGDFEPVESQASKLEFVSGPREGGGSVVEETPDRTRGGTAAISPNEDILPSAVKTAKKIPAIIEDSEPAGAASIRVTEPPTILGNEPGFVTRQAEKASDIHDVMRQSLMESDSHALRRMGPYGAEIDRLGHLKDSSRDAFSGPLSANLNRAAEGMSEEQIHNAIDIVEGKTPTIQIGDKTFPVNDPMVQNLVKVIQDNDKAITKLMTESGSQMRSSVGNLMPFEARSNYFPHKFPEGFFENNKAEIIQSLMQEKGVSAVDAERILMRARQNNPILNDALHERLANFGGYRKDLDVLHKHYIDMADRAFTDKYFGVNDIASKEPNTINDLIANVGRDKGLQAEQQTREIVSKFLRHDQFQDSPGVRALTQIQALTKLGLSAPSNTAGGMVMAGAKGDFFNFTRGVIGALTKNGRFDAQSLGTLQSLYRDAASEVGYSSKLHYGNKWVEEFLRSMSGLTGKYQAESIFASLKKNPGSSYQLARLKDLLLEEPANVLKQDKLTPMQLGVAANRFTDMTQGRVNPLDLPHHWSNEPMANLLVQFKKYAFIQSKNLKDMIVQDLSHGRINPALKLIAGSQLFGEAAGDIKALVKGGPDAIANRPEGVMRAIDNASNAFGIGLIGEALKAASTGRPADVISFLAGPTVGMGADLASGAVSSAKTQSFKPIIRSSLRQFVPIYGSSLAKSEALKDTKD